MGIVREDERELQEVLEKTKRAFTCNKISKVIIEKKISKVIIERFGKECPV